MNPAAERLSEIGVERLQSALCLAEGLRALADLAALIDPGAERSAWSLAGELETRIRRFEGTAWDRIRRGARDPRDILEMALADFCSCPCLPRSQRKLYELLD